LVEVGINRRADRPASDATIERRRRGNCDLGHALRMRGDELEVIDHGVGGKAELAGDSRAFGAGLYAGKRDSLIHDFALHPVETPEEVEMPPRAPELAVGNG